MTEGGGVNNNSNNNNNNKIEYYIKRIDDLMAICDAHGEISSKDCSVCLWRAVRNLKKAHPSKIAATQFLKDVPKSKIESAYKEVQELMSMEF